MLRKRLKQDFSYLRQLQVSDLQDEHNRLMQPHNMNLTQRWLPQELPKCYRNCNQRLSSSWKGQRTAAKQPRYQRRPSPSGYRTLAPGNVSPVFAVLYASIYSLECFKCQHIIPNGAGYWISIMLPSLPWLPRCFIWNVKLRGWREVAPQDATTLYAVGSQQGYWWEHVTSIHHFLLYYTYAAESKVSTQWIRIYT